MKHRLQDILALVAILSVGSTMLLYAQESKRGVITADSTEILESDDRYVVCVIGIDNYQYLPKLDNAVQDAIGVRSKSIIYRAVPKDLDI